MRWFLTGLLLGVLASLIPIIEEGNAADFTIYSVYRGIYLGNSDEQPEKDFYINMGSAQGVREGTILEVLRRIPTYDELSQQLYRDVTFAIARVKVIHVESKVAVARLDKMLPIDKTPSISPRAIMVGDIVRFPEPITEKTVQ